MRTGRSATPLTLHAPPDRASRPSGPLGPNDALLLKLEQQVATARHRMNATTGRQSDSACERVCMLEGQVYRTSPETIVGLAAKARVIRKEIAGEVEFSLREGHTENFEVILDRLAQDVERIAEQ